MNQCHPKLGRDQKVVRRHLGLSIHVKILGLATLKINQLKISKKMKKNYDEKLKYF
jgi:hypothetical protein